MDPTRPQIMMLNLDVGAIGTQADSAPDWKALAYIVGSQAFCEAANSLCVCMAQRQKLAEAAELYAKLAIEEVDNLRRRKESSAQTK
jgi:hypothetical protein